MKQANVTKSQWAAWFPYPKSWLRALGLLLLFMGVVTILRILIYWGLPVSLILSQKQDSTPIIAFLSTVYFVIPIILISSIHYILFGKSSPRWLPKLKSLWVGFYSWIAINLSTLVSFGLVIPFIERYPSSHYESSYFKFTDVEVFWLSSIWLVTAAYLNHGEYLLKRWLSANFRTPHPAASSQPTGKNFAIDDVGVELDNLRGQMGLHKMKGKDKPKPKQ